MTDDDQKAAGAPDTPETPGSPNTPEAPDTSGAPEPGAAGMPGAKAGHLEPTSPGAAGPDPNRLTPAWARFRSCRWRSDPDDGEYCTHRDVLPYAGKEGFVPESWCPDCQYFKLKRVARKPSY